MEQPLLPSLPTACGRPMSPMWLKASFRSLCESLWSGFCRGFWLAQSVYEARRCPAVSPAASCSRLSSPRMLGQHVLANWPHAPRWPKSTLFIAFAPPCVTACGFWAPFACPRDGMPVAYTCFSPWFAEAVLSAFLALLLRGTAGTNAFDPPPV